MEISPSEKPQIKCRRKTTRLCIHSSSTEEDSVNSEMYEYSTEEGISIREREYWCRMTGGKKKNFGNKWLFRWMYVYMTIMNLLLYTNDFHWLYTRKDNWRKN